MASAAFFAVAVTVMAPSYARNTSETGIIETRPEIEQIINQMSPKDVAEYARIIDLFKKADESEKEGRYKAAGIARVKAIKDLIEDADKKLELIYKNCSTPACTINQLQITPAKEAFAFYSQAARYAERYGKIDDAMEYRRHAAAAAADLTLAKPTENVHYLINALGEWLSMADNNRKEENAETVREIRRLKNSLETARQKGKAANIISLLELPLNPKTAFVLFSFFND